MKDSENIIETKMLSKKFFSPGLPFFPVNEYAAVKKIDLAVKKGEVCGLLGRNGAGKTTLMKMLATLIRPTSGLARVNHFDVCKEEAKVRQSIGFISNDERSFYWRLTGLDNLMFFAALQGIYGEKAGTLALSVLRLVGLEKKKDTPVQKYSAGMKQRLAISRGLLHDPRVLFLDEPTKALDPFVSEEIWGFIRRELVGKRGMTLFVATHNLTETLELCDSVALMHGGEIKVKLGKGELDSEKKLKQTFMEHTCDES